MTTTSRQAAVSLTVGQVANQVGVTVRTLHHYDSIGLLVPSGRSAAGYRLYTPRDLEVLSRVVTYRRLGIPLDEVAALLSGGDVLHHLRHQRAMVMSRLGELEALVTAIDKAMEREMENRPATTEDLKEIFGEGYDEDRQAEARERWGESDQWRLAQYVHDAIQANARPLRLRRRRSARTDRLG